MKGPERTGDIGDPVADSIRSEQNRDAMPTAEEVQEMHQKMLEASECISCGEEDADKLELRKVHYAPEGCSQAQASDFDPFEVECDDCHEEHGTALERAIKSTFDEHGVVVEYTCGRLLNPLDAVSNMEGDKVELNPGLISPECYCGKPIKEVHYKHGGK